MDVPLTEPVKVKMRAGETVFRVATNWIEEPETDPLEMGPLKLVPWAAQPEAGGAVVSRLTIAPLIEAPFCDSVIVVEKESVPQLGVGSESRHVPTHCPATLLAGAASSEPESAAPATTAPPTPAAIPAMAPLDSPPPTAAAAAEPAAEPVTIPVDEKPAGRAGSPAGPWTATLAEATVAAISPRHAPRASATTTLNSSVRTVPSAESVTSM